MGAHDARAVLAAVLVAVAVAAVLAPVAAAGADDRADRGDAADGNGTDDGGDGGLEVFAAFETGEGAGWGHVDCDGEPTNHECDKGGALAAGPVAVDYDGHNYGDDEAFEGGGGDEVLVGVGNETAGVGFVCDLSTEAPSENPCPVYVVEDEDDDRPAQERGDDGPGDGQGEGADRRNDGDRGADDRGNGGGDDGALGLG